MIQLLVDDGSTSRGHRKNILNPAFNYIGVFTGDHSEFGNVSCIDYAGGFIAKGDTDII